MELLNNLAKKPYLAIASIEHVAWCLDEIAAGRLQEKFCGVSIVLDKLNKHGTVVTLAKPIAWIQPALMHGLSVACESAGLELMLHKNSWGWKAGSLPLVALALAKDGVKFTGLNLDNGFALTRLAITDLLGAGVKIIAHESVPSFADLYDKFSLVVKGEPNKDSPEITSCDDPRLKQWAAQSQACGTPFAVIIGRNAAFSKYPVAAANFLGLMGLVPRFYGVKSGKLPYEMVEAWRDGLNLFARGIGGGE